MTGNVRQEAQRYRVTAKATARSQSSWGIRSEGGARVWRQCANCAANWSSWWSPCNGVVIVMVSSQSSGSCAMDDCRPAKIELHARWSEADGAEAGTAQAGARRLRVPGAGWVV